VRDFWIRVDGDLHDRAVTTRLCEWLNIREHEAMGILIVFWSGVVKAATNGFIRDYPDKQLAKFAKLSGKKGQKFAAWIRAQHMDPDGRVPEWDDYQGLLELQRQRDRERKSEERRRKSEGRPKDVTGMSLPTEDGDVDVDVTRTIPPPTASSSELRVDEFLERSGQRERWLRQFDGWLGGIGYPAGKAAHPADIQVGCAEYVSNEKNPDFGVRHVLSYVTKAEKRRRSGGDKPNDKRRGASAWDDVA
jgi:hypothetical protein